MINKKEAIEVLFKFVHWLATLMLVAHLGFASNHSATEAVVGTNENVKVPAENRELGEKIDEILKAEQLEGAIAAVSVRSANSGELLYETFGDVRLKPASNMKILTGAAALDLLGEDYTFKTKVLTDGNKRGKVLHGNIYLKGKGDPTLLKKDFADLAESLYNQGIQRIHGHVIADDSWYDDVRYSEDVSWNDEYQYYGAQISALTASPNEDYDAGTVIVEVEPAKKAGKKAHVKVTPNTDYVSITNKVKTVAESSKRKIKIERKHGNNEIIVQGEIPVKSTNSRNWVAVWEPSMYALDLFVSALKEKGIKITRNSTLKRGKAPKEATLLAEKESMPLKELMIPFMKLSNNTHAEILVKEMGKVHAGEGSWKMGLKVMNETLQELGLNTTSLKIRDGSGISHVNMIPANDISHFLYTIQGHSWFPSLLESFPVAGVEERFVGGTLRNRMKDTPAAENVQAKTGSLTGVSALSGYVTNSKGELLIFSIILNNFLEGDGHEIEDNIANVLATS